MARGSLARLVSFLTFCHAVSEIVYPSAGSGESVAGWNNAPQRVLAFVISLDDGRFNRSSALLLSCGLDVKRVHPIPADDASVRELHDLLPGESFEEQRKTLSLHMTTRWLWASAALDPSHGLADDDFFLIFEDDIGLDEHVTPQRVLSIAHHASAASKSTGLFYLGMGCGWFCARPDYKHHLLSPLNEVGVPCAEPHEVNVAPPMSWWHDGVQFSRCVGLTTHAYGVHKWRALWLWQELHAAGFRNTLLDRDRAYNTPVDYRLHLAVRDWYGHSAWPVVAGRNFFAHSAPEELSDGACPTDSDFGWGVFYQAASSMPSYRRTKTGDRSAAASSHELGPGDLSPPRSQQQHKHNGFHASPPAAALVIGSASTAASELLTGLRLASVQTLRRLHASDKVVQITLTRPVGLASSCIGACDMRILSPLLAHTLSHRLAWMTLATDASVADTDYVLVLDEGVGATAASVLGRLDALTLQSAAEASRAAGLFFLSDCGGELRRAEAANSSWSVSGWTLTRGVTSCTSAYGLFKWRAAWLWDALLAVQAPGQETFASSLGAAFMNGLPRLLHPDDWPVVLRAA